MPTLPRLRIDRRDLLRHGALLGGLGAIGALVAACGGAPPSPTTAPVAKPTEPAKPATTAAAPATTKPAAAPSPAATTAAVAKPASASASEGVVKWIVYASPLANKWQAEYAIPEYKKLFPKVEINHIQVPYAEFNPKIFAMQAAGDTPNIFGFDLFATWRARGLAVPIDDYLNAEPGLAGQFFKSMFDTYKWEGKHWGLPAAPRFGNMTFYNKDLFDKAGVPYPKIDFTLKEWNVDVMLEKAQKLTQNVGKPDVVYGIDFNPWSPHGLAYLWGGDTYTKEMYDNGIATETTIDSQASRDGHQFKVDLIQKHKVHASAADQQTISVVGDPFKTGRVAMTVQGGWAWGSFSDIKTFKWGVAPVPGKTAVKNSENLNIWMLGNAPKGREASWEFMKFLTSAEAQRQWVGITGSQPSRPDVLDDWIKRHTERMSAEEIRGLINENLKHTVESMDHLVVDYLQYDDPYRQAVATLWDGKITVNDFVAKMKTAWDGTAKEIYGRYKDRLVK